ncbi:MAG: tRNA epoxyqueuosine(34) reductase QueG [Planctomycetes bacterium]|nr:tRNA epoxyqueuosine(34) reductase QueG [Planctomycetota bacterium]
MLETRLKQQAQSLGFDLAGIAKATDADGFDRYTEWLDRGYAGEMVYMHSNAAARRHPESILANVRSVLMLGMTYSEGGMRDSKSESKPGRVARYARGPDYHDVIWDKLDHLLDWLKKESPGCQGRGVVDSAPLLERDFARRAGLGWFGKNTLLLNKHQGSFFFLGALLVDLDLRPDDPHFDSHCGSCTACLDACPTQAFQGPGWLDSRRCISYLTIELRTAIPEGFRVGMGDWLFGCDVCQEVCPWNGKTRPSSLPRQDELAALDPIELLGLSESEFRKRFRETALWRAKRKGLLRNAAIVLGNRGDEIALPALQKSLQDDEPLIREAAAWAIKQIHERICSRAERLPVDFRVEASQ